MSSTSSIYKLIMEQVLERVHDDFSNAGLDESTLLDLKALWTQKLLMTRALGQQYVPTSSSHPTTTTTNAAAAAASSQNAPNISGNHQGLGDDDDDLHLYTSTSFPFHNFQQSQQQQQQQQQQGPRHATPAANPANPHHHHHHHQPGRLHQLDGELDDSEDSDDDNNDQPVTAPLAERDELINSDLDDDDEEDINLLSSSSNANASTSATSAATTNRMLCQFEKVTRSRNKWKCVLKDGVVSVAGVDYLFHKAQCDFEF